MPAVVVTIVRYIVITVVQLGIVAAIEKYVLPLINKGIEAIMVTFGVDREEATDIMANSVIATLESIGIFAAVMSTKMPVKLAEKLGFTSKGWKKRTLKPTTEAKIASKGKPVSFDIKNPKIITAAESAEIVVAAQRNVLGFKPAYDILLKVVGVTFMGFMVVGNWIDFGNWNNGAYQKSMQKFIAWISFGALVPDEDYRKSLTVSDAIFSKIYNTFKIGGAQGIQDPFKGVDVPFTRDNLLDLTDQVGGQLLLLDGTASAKKVLAAVLPMIIFSTSADVDSAISKYGQPSKTTTTTATTITTPKVFTGIVSQGVVGSGLVFQSRPDDLIESLEELRVAAANNLVPYLNTFLSKVIYEVKIVSTIITKDGFKQRGTTQRIQTGTFTNGQPKYKTVTNKFATLIIYVLTDKGSRTKVTTIVLGPVDSSKLVIGINDLATLELSLSKDVVTQDLGDITKVTTDKPISIQTTTEQAQNQNNIKTTGGELLPNYWNKLGITDERWYSNEFDETSKAANLDVYTRNLAANIPFTNALKSPVVIIQQNNQTPTQNTTSVPTTVPVVNSTTQTAIKTVSNAATLYEWYKTQGQSLPSVSERSLIYEGLGLGSRNYYTGTSEQNTKLLNALKSGTNVAALPTQDFGIVNNSYLEIIR